MSLIQILKNYKKSGTEAKILILGLDNAGKTTILKQISNEEITSIEPTKGFNVKTLIQENFKLNMWDLGGQKEIRQYWTYYFEQVQGIVKIIFIFLFSIFFRFMLLILLMMLE